MNSANSSLWAYCERQVCTSAIAINSWPAIFSAFHRSRYLVLVATSFKHLKSHPLSNIDCGNDVEAKSFSGTTCNWSLTSWRVSWTGLVISAKSSTIFRINLSFFFFLLFFGVFDFYPFAHYVIVARQRPDNLLLRGQTPPNPLAAFPLNSMNKSVPKHF